ncbi:hypothetical protein PG994_001834 [Apiospora phragmitis]|uniref:T6SS Phospholipase effector Tle1-like catalytic domain-containing protein n=1 Tax=Apiospora phragmitis TaxID=2905665 RepID=A0ABR1WUJ6_9PEZI
MQDFPDLRAFHALALDERRGPFSPTLWHFPAEDGLAASQPDPNRTHEEIAQAWDDVQAAKDPTPGQVTQAWSDLVDCEMYDQLKKTKSELLQVWFPGVHINLDDIDADFGNLARATVEDRFNLVKPVLNRITHGEKDLGTNWLTRKAWEALDWSGLKKVQLKHVANDVVNGWATGPIVDSYCDTMMLAGPKPRRARRDPRDDPSLRRVPHEEEEDRHSSVQAGRLKGFHRDVRQATDEKKYEWTSSGKKGSEWTWTSDSKEGGDVVEVLIPEYLIKPEHVFTRHLAMQDSLEAEGTASDFIGEIDREVGAKTQEADILNTREARKKARLETGTTTSFSF